MQFGRHLEDTHQLFGPEKTMRYVSETLDVAGHPYTLVRSNVCEEALPAGIGKISVANVDVDIYEATRDALLRVAPLMVPGGSSYARTRRARPCFTGPMWRCASSWKCPRAVASCPS
jgi:hypothetical protein